MSENYLNQAINGAVRTSLVLYPTLRASQHLLEIARRTLNAGLGLVGLELKLPPAVDRTNGQAWKDASTQSKLYTYAHDYLPKSVTEQNDAFRNLEGKDLVKGFVFYTAVATVATFVANKFIGQTPAVYNTVSAWAGSSLRIDRDYDVIQMAVNYVSNR